MNDHNNALPTILIILVSFLCYYTLFLNFSILKAQLDTVTHQGLISYMLTYLLIGIPIFLGTYVINRGNVVISLGLSKNILTGIGLAILFTLPMFVGGMIYFTFNAQMNLQNLVAGTIVAGFMEELYFRGFLFGQLFRNTAWGFIPSIFFGALIFAFGHLWQGQNINELTGIFAVTFFGAIFFAWLYTEWNYNIWVAIFTHTLMNLSWSLFEVDVTALGDVKANIFRGLTIAVAIIFTLVYKRRNSLRLEITRRTLFCKKKNGDNTIVN